jgi:hypothetical protein
MMNKSTSWSCEFSNPEDDTYDPTSYSDDPFGGTERLIDTYRDKNPSGGGAKGDFAGCVHRTQTSPASLRWLIEHSYIKSTRILEYIITEVIGGKCPAGHWASFSEVSNLESIVSTIASSSLRVLDGDIIESCMTDVLPSYRHKRPENLLELYCPSHEPEFLKQSQFNLYDDHFVLFDIEALRAIAAMFVYD